METQNDNDQTSTFSEALTYNQARKDFYMMVICWVVVIVLSILI